MAEHTPQDAPTGSEPARKLARGELVEAEVKALDLSGIPTVIFGTAAWAVAFLVLLLFFRDDLDRHDAEWWLAVTGTGFGLGLAGVVYCRRRWAAIQRDRAGQSATS